MRSIRRVGATWEAWGHDDPLYGVLADPAKRGGGWDDDAFLATGVAHIEGLLGHIAASGLTVPSGAVLDFGCGAGRLTHALAARFDDVTGVDISPSMIERARAVAPGSPARFTVSADPDLRRFASGSCGLVMSFLVLQHLPPRLALGYVTEFLRVLRPGGLAVFQVSESFLPPARLLDSRRLGPAVRNALVRWRGRLLRRNIMELHLLPGHRVVSAVTAAGGEVCDVGDDGSGGGFCVNVRYIVRKRGGGG